MDKRTINRQKIIISVLLLIIIALIIYAFALKDETYGLTATIADQNITINSMQKIIDDVESNGKDKEIDLGWELVLVNSENKVPDDYKFTLENLDGSRKFDSRAIKYLKNMMRDAKEDGITNFWAQSTYRTIELQEALFNEKVQEYKAKGFSESISKVLTETSINKPGYSEHNIGLCVDFNNVDDAFEKSSAFKWLKDNAEEYGFILRYPKDKEEITKVKYEPWHWRFVGKDNAQEMNELNMCLEEYVEYLKSK